MSESLSPEPLRLLPEQYDLLAAVGNNELKSFTLGVMKDGVPYGQTGLHRELISIQGEPVVWRMGIFTPTSYCQHSFSAIGLVAKTTLDYNGAPAYEITQKGAEVGKSLVGHLLDISLFENESLIDFIGPTNTNSRNLVRPCERRIKLLKLLTDSLEARSSAAEIAEGLDLRNSHIGSIFDDLTSSGLVSRETVGRGNPKVRYAATPKLFGATHRNDISTPLYRNAVTVIEKYFQNNPDATISNSELAGELVKEGYEPEITTALVRKVTSITTRLSSIRGLLSAHQTGEDGARDVVFITENQRKTIGNFLLVISGLQSGSEDFVAEGKDKLKVILSDREMVRYLIDKAQKSSIGLKRTPGGQDAILEQIKTSFVDVTQPRTITEIRAELLPKGINLDRLTIRKMLDSQISLGFYVKAPSPRGEKYMPVELPSGRD